MARMVAEVAQPPATAQTQPELNTGVYCIRNKVNGKMYVGSAARSLTKRFESHKRALRTKAHHNLWLQRSWNKYGESAFEFLVLERCAPIDCIAREQFHIDSTMAYTRGIGYNMCPTAGSCLGRKHREVAKNKFSEIAKRRVISPETREKIAATLRDKWKNPEFREKWLPNILLNQPKTVPATRRRKGIPLSNETKEKISASARMLPSHTIAKRNAARWASADSREKASNVLKKNRSSHGFMEKRRLGLIGHAVSQECRKKISEKIAAKWKDPLYRNNMIQKLTGHSVSEEARKKMSEAKIGKPAHNRGIPLSPAHREKLRIAWIGRKARMELAHQVHER